MLRIVMDSAGDLPEEWIKKYEIDIIPINVHLGDKVFLEDVNLTIVQFYEWVKKTGLIPKTSQPSIGQFMEFYRQIAEPGDVILSVHLTSKLSGTFESAVLAAREMSDEPYEIHTFDTLAGTGIQGYMCRAAREMDRAGKSIAEIINRLEEIRDNTQVIFTVDSLEFAQKSGRVNLLESILASVLKIKPIITLQEGTLAVADKVRTRKASLEYVVREMSRRMGNKLVSAAVMHANDLKTGLEISKKIEEVMRVKEIFVQDLSVAIATHLGPGTVGIIAYPEAESGVN